MWTFLVLALTLPFIFYIFQANSIDPIAAYRSLICSE